MYIYYYPKLPNYFDYIISGLLFLSVIIILKKLRKIEDREDRKEGCGALLFHIVGAIPFLYLLLNVFFAASFALYGILAYPNYKAEVVDSITKLTGKTHTTKRKIYHNFAIFELEDENEKTIRIESNEGTSEKIVIGLSANVSYKDGIIIKNSFLSIMLYIGTIIVSFLISLVLIIVVFSKV